MKKWLFMLCSLLAIMMISCSKDSEEESLAGTKWLFSAYNNKQLTFITLDFFSESAVKLIIEAARYKDGTAVVGCRNGQGSFEKKGDTVFITMDLVEDGKPAVVTYSCVLSNDSLLLNLSEGGEYPLSRVSSANTLAGTFWSSDTYKWWVSFLPDNKVVLCTANEEVGSGFDLVMPGLYKYDSSGIEIVLDSKWDASQIKITGSVDGSNLNLTDIFGDYWNTPGKDLQFSKVNQQVTIISGN